MATKPKAVRKVLRSFKLSEISAVTNPAQEGALVALMKADRTLPLFKVEERPKTFAALVAYNQEQEKKYAAERKMWPYFSTLQEVLSKIASDTNLDEKAKLVAVEKAIEEFKEAMAKEFPSMAEEVKKFLTTTEWSMPDNKTDDLQKQVAELTLRAEQAEALAKMSDAEKAYCEKMSPDEKKKFMAMSAEDRTAAMKKSADADEVIKISGHYIRKSQVGEASFEIFKAQQAQIEAQRVDLAKANEAAEIEKFSKVADTDFGYLPGTTIEKAHTLRALSKLDEKARATVETMLKGGNAAMKSKMSQVGGSGSGDDGASALQKFNAAAKAIADRDKVSPEKAMAKAMNEHPDLYKAYESERRRKQVDDNEE